MNRLGSAWPGGGGRYGTWSISTDTWPSQFTAPIIKVNCAQCRTLAISWINDPANLIKNSQKDEKHSDLILFLSIDHISGTPEKSGVCQ